MSAPSIVILTGAGKVLTGLVRRIAPAAATLAVTKPDEVAEFRASFDL